MRSKVPSCNGKDSEYTLLTYKVTEKFAKDNIFNLSSLGWILNLLCGFVFFNLVF